jgi:hypothetical protein
MIIRSSIVAVTIAAGTALPAAAHLHVNMTPSSADEGAKLTVTHYGGSGFDIVSAGDRLEMHRDGGIYTVTADTVVTNEYHSIAPGFLTGLRRGGIANFTADGSPAAERLNNPTNRTVDGVGKPVGYELVSVVNVTTGDPLAQPYRVEWRFIRGPATGTTNLRLPDPFSGYATFAGNSAADTAEGRSYLLRVGAHVHGSGAFPDSGFFLFTDAPVGLYDITIRAWDVEGYFTASDPVTFQLSVIPEPASLLVVGAALAAIAGRRKRGS